MQSAVNLKNLSSNSCMKTCEKFQKHSMQKEVRMWQRKFQEEIKHIIPVVFARLFHPPIFAKVTKENIVYLKTLF